MMKKYMLQKKGILFFLLLTLDAVNVALMAVLLKQTLDAAISGDWNELMIAAFFIVVFLVEYSLVSWGTRAVKVLYISDIMFGLKQDLLSNLLKEPVKKFSERNSAEYISLFNNELKLMEDNYIASVILIYRSVVILVVSLVIMLSIDPVVSFIAVILSFLPVLIPKLFGAKLSEAAGDYTKQLKKYNRFVDDILRGFYVVRNFSLEFYMNEKHQKENCQAESMRKKLGKRKAYVDVVTNLVAVGMQFSVFLISGFFVVLKRITAGDVLAVTQLMNKVVNPVFDVIDSLNNMKSVREIEKGILEIINKDGNEDVIKIECPQVNEIELKNVAFSYTGNERILTDVSLRFKKGKKYAIVGETGSGKSTLLKLIQGYYDNYEGEIYYNDTDIREIGQETCMRVFSYMSQAIFLFEGTIRENILFDHSTEEGRLQKIIRDLKLDETLEKNGIDLSFQLKDSGGNLSGGEREKIALARLLLNKKEWLLLDEATASMDNETLLQIEKMLMEQKDTACIFVTHRYREEILRRYDKIIVMKQGKVVETGSFEELMQREGSFFSLCRGCL